MDKTRRKARIILTKDVILITVYSDNEETQLIIKVHQISDSLK